MNRQSVKKADVKKIAANATSASAKLADRQVPAGHTRSAGGKYLLAEWQSLRLYHRCRVAARRLARRGVVPLVARRIGHGFGHITW
jgi:hypothetical protein